MDSFGRYLKSIRLQKNFNQNDLSQQADIKNTYLSKIENDKTDPPSEEVLIRLAVALEMNPNELIIRAGKVPAEFQQLILNEPEVFQYLENRLKDIRSR